MRYAITVTARIHQKLPGRGAKPSAVPNSVYGATEPMIIPSVVIVVIINDG